MSPDYFRKEDALKQEPFINCKFIISFVYLSVGMIKENFICEFHSESNELVGNLPYYKDFCKTFGCYHYFTFFISRIFI